MKGSPARRSPDDSTPSRVEAIKLSDPGGTIEVMAWTYMLLCADGSYYVGSTRYRELGLRLDQHASGKGSVYTGSRLPVELAWSQEADTVKEAWAVERQLHGWRRSKREALARGDIELLPELSASKTEAVDDAPDP